MASSRLTLRPLRPADCARLLTWVKTEDDLYQWSGVRSFSWPLDHGQLLRDLEASGEPRLLFAAVDDDGEMAGHVMLDINRHHRAGLIGRVAVAPERRGQGWGTSLMRETVGHAFDEQGLHRLQLAVYTFNAAAIACYRSVGFLVEGASPDSARGASGYWTSLTMSLLEPDYRRPLVLGDGIRLATPRDADAVAALLTGDGHPHTREQAATRLLSWAADPQGIVLVAEASGSVAGAVAAHGVPAFDQPGRGARIAWLAVNEHHRDGTLEARLVDAATRWCSARGDGVPTVKPSGPEA